MLRSITRRSFVTRPQRSMLRSTRTRVVTQQARAGVQSRFIGSAQVSAKPSLRLSRTQQMRRWMSDHPPTASLAQLSETFADGTSANYVEQMYRAWRADNTSVHASWAAYFENIDNGVPPGQAAQAPPSLGGPSQSISGGQGGGAHADSLRLFLLIRAYQVLGHRKADIDPLGIRKPTSPAVLDPKAYGFTDADLDRTFSVGDSEFASRSGFLNIASAKMTLRDLIKLLERTYCNTIGYQYMHIMDTDRCNWLRERIEVLEEKKLSKEKKISLLDRLYWSHMFEEFIQLKHGSKKRFGLDGLESFVPGMKFMIDRAAKTGTKSVVMGMAHRGRLNVLANVVRKPLAAIFKDFEDPENVTTDILADAAMSGDVKYHLGTSYDRPTANGKQVHLSLVANPSHLEAVNPLVAGKTRAKRHYSSSDDVTHMPLLIHGDAAFAGQGIVYEMMCMSKLPNYDVGGTIHIITNNQVGFTTDPIDARSSEYCTDVARSIEVPIFHVNGDDPEAVVKVCELAADWRNHWHEDVVVDVVGYRRLGHNEGDRPEFTQPLMYKTIKTHPTVLEKYTKQLLEEGVVDEAFVEKLKNNVQGELERGYKQVADYETKDDDWLGSYWKGFKSFFETSKLRDTGVSVERIKSLGEKLVAIPEGFNAQRVVKKVYQERESMIQTGEKFDFAMAEALAFASLMEEGNHVRLAGQDVQRGTFSHRHAYIHDQDTGNKYSALEELGKNEGYGSFSANNSPLNEYAAMGFELGYSLENPNSLILWEGQFGDFANGAQIIIDQFLSAGEQKWKRQSGLVLLLPHGYEGQGPEHSSARIERFLQMSESNPFEYVSQHEDARQTQLANWQIVNCTTPANYFHALRRQVHRDFRKPLIIFTPKSILRAASGAMSSIEDIDDKDEHMRFMKVIPECEPENLVAKKKVRKLIFCSGKVFYDLKKERSRLCGESKTDVAIARIEQLYPFPFDAVKEVSSEYPNAEIVWTQEEPMNQGPWWFVMPHIRTAVRAWKKNFDEPTYVGRQPAAATATGSAKYHQAELKQLLEDAFA